MKKEILLVKQSLRGLSDHLKLLLAVFAFMAASSLQAQSTIQGKIVDEEGSGLPGVNVLIKGTTQGTATDADGKYSLNVPDGTTDPILVFSFIGYAAQEQSVGGRTTIDVKMVADARELGEVVVVGYGTQKKADVTGSIVSVKATELREVPAANIQQALQGRAAGVDVQMIGTAPGAGARIRVRGDRSINGSNDPLIVLDGIPYDGSLNDINQDEIATIDVLKDASATAIYGSRGANGVLLITTRRGKSGETKINVDSYYGATTVARPYKMMNSEQYAAMRDASGWPNGYQPEEIQGMGVGRNTDWQKLMYQNGFRSNTNIGVSGGNDKTQFSLSGGYYKETTVLPGQDFSRYSIKATIDTKIGEKLKVGINTMNTLNNTTGSQFVNQQPDAPGAFGGSALYGILSLSPLMPAYDANGNVFTQPAGNVDDRSANYSPLLLKNNNNSWTDNIQRLRTFNSLFAEYQIIDGLKYRVNVGLDFNQQNSTQFQGTDSYFRPHQGNRAQVRNSQTAAWTIENLLTYDKTIKEKHHLNFTGLYSAQQSSMFYTQVERDSITADFTQFYNLGASSNTAPTYLLGDEQTWGIVSYMGRLNYTFDNRFLITATYRRDGSSRLANKWHEYPAVAVGWNIINESFIQNISTISNLKLRASYGQTSNQSVNPYTTLGGVTNTFNSNNTNYPIKYNYGTQQTSGYIPSRLPDKNLDWEYTNTVDIGLDFGILKNRITGTIDWYSAKTNKILYNQTLPISSGYQDQFQTNVGTMENHGLEISISATVLKTPSGFTWGVDANWFNNRNKITSLASGVKQDIANGLIVGSAMNAIYDFKKLGIWQTSEAAEAATYGQKPGSLKIADLNGPNKDGKPDGVLDPNYDRTVIGDQQANWQGGITNRFTYKGFDLSIVAYARMGGLLISNVHAPFGNYLTNLDGKRNSLQVDYWTPNNPTNNFPAPGASAPTGATTAWTTLGYYDASFVRIRSINFGYNLPSALLKKVGAKAIRFYVTAQNPFLLWCPYVTKYNGVDPEPSGQGGTGAVTTGGNIRTTGPNQNLIISATTPPTKTFLVGLNLTF